MTNATTAPSTPILQSKDIPSTPAPPKPFVDRTPDDNANHHLFGKIDAQLFLPDFCDCDKDDDEGKAISMKFKSLSVVDPVCVSATSHPGNMLTKRLDQRDAEFMSLLGFGGQQ
eukprot:CAMPEP_0116036726 /NCGR_PEP_ID=MMETSP0321-20121206/21445_1 /TAXON_ID=163516 /ORGANISM="Leptocylindrus danicus var. danicus, Strain B650" /LENGTH=113 /DNA_ID=CAMNT_0003514425 /DNA_START=33 /DNA_END=374 /DNA_ORIENTATION=+